MEKPAAQPALSPIFSLFEPSPIAQIFSKATSLIEAGRTLYNFSTGEPDFDTPTHVREAAKRSIDEGNTKYSPINGTSALKQAVQRKFARDNDLHYETDEIIIGFGAKPLLTSAIQAVIGPGDEMLLSTPCWPSHVGMIQLAGGTPRFIETNVNSSFKFTSDDLRAAIGPQTKAILLCSPSNPTGAMYSAAELKALAEVLLEHPQVWIISDDLYEHIVFDDAKFATIAQVEPRLADRTLTVNGVSKCYAMTGWRIGYAGGPANWVRGISELFTQSNGGCCSISQTASIAALDGPQDFLKEWAAIYQHKRDMAVRALAQIPELRCLTPEGAFYAFVECGGVLGKTTQDGFVIENSKDFAQHLLESWDVVVVPGSGFFADPYFRMSVATDEDTIERGIGRIAEACAALR